GAEVPSRSHRRSRCDQAGDPESDVDQVEQDARLEHVEELGARPGLPPVQVAVVLHDAGDEAEHAEGDEHESRNPREALRAGELPHGYTLRREALDDPAPVARPVPKAVVKTVDAVLPELPRRGREAEAAPALRSWDILTHRAPELRCRALERLAARD